MAFISYPEAIAKFKYLPQLFAVLFFFMLLVLGIGSNIGMVSSVINVIKDRFPHLPHWKLATGASLIGFVCGLVYMTPGGQFVLNLVDFYGCTFIALVLAIAELLAVGWVYGVKRVCNDIEFMLNVKTGVYWRICWALVAPGLMFLVLIYMLCSYEPLTYKGVVYPQAAYTAGWLIWALGVAQLPFWALYTIYQQPGDSFSSVSGRLYASCTLLISPSLSPSLSYRSCVLPCSPRRTGVRARRSSCRRIGCIASCRMRRHRSATLISWTTYSVSRLQYLVYTKIETRWYF